MFLMQYRHSIDNKGRLTIPARYRELITDGAYVTQGFDRNLMVLTEPIFERMSGRIAKMSLTDPDVRQLRRLIYSHADRVEVDKAGRILIPQVLREIAGLDSEAMVVGQFDYFEIWSPEVWEQQSSTLKDTEANARRFAVFDLSTGAE